VEAPVSAAGASAGAGRATNLIARLEKELRELWDQPGDPSVPKASRVCTMNLEVVASSKELLARYQPVVDEVTASIPARAILASIEPDAPGDELTGAATFVCRLEGDRNVCSERITLAATGEACARSASAVEAFLVPEIPTALVWLGKVHVDDPVFEDLANDAQRIIVDSEYTSLASLLHVTSWARRQTNRPHVADLAWVRLASWQELLARLFDAGEVRPLARKIKRLRLEQASPRGARLGPEPALLLGWIGTRLDWKVSRLGGALRVKRDDGGSVAIELAAVPCPPGVAPNTLASVSVEAEDDQTGVSMKGSIRRELASGLEESGAPTTPDADVICWKQSTAAATFEQHVRLGPNKAAKWLERTLHRPAADPAFDESVAFAEHLVEDGLTVA
jgi:glucose-6-phosphate dehydrogenase assembly protein OpcA